LSKAQQTEDIARLSEMKLQLSCLAEALRLDKQQATSKVCSRVAQFLDCSMMFLFPKAAKELPDLLPILRFRVAVVAVMAANRLNHFGQNSSCVTTLRDSVPGIGCMEMHAGDATAEKHKFVGENLGTSFCTPCYHHDWKLKAL
jgi:hypothetical protein